ncbi:MAG: PPOX class F420-dependent oxidoreductase [Nitrosopumilus sp.]
MKQMARDEIRFFLLQGTFTGKLGTINDDGTPHIVPIWFILDDEGNIVFNTGNKSIKAKNIRRDNRVRFCVDDQIPPFSFVTLDGNAEIISDIPGEVFKWAKKIAARYMGNDKAEQYGKRNSSTGELLLKITPNKIIGQKDITGW